MRDDIEETKARSLPVWLHFDDHDFSAFVLHKVLHHYRVGTQVYIIFWGDWLATDGLSDGWYEVFQSTISFSEEHGDVRTLHLTKPPKDHIQRPDGFPSPLLIVRPPDYRLAI